MPLKTIPLLLATAAMVHAFEFEAGQEITSYVGKAIQMHPADLDSDGDLDLVALSVSRGIQIFENTGAGRFERGAIWETSGADVLQKVEDFDADGIPDLLLSEAKDIDPEPARILYGSGLAGYGPRETSLGTFEDARWYNTVIHDVDLSGKPDLILWDRVIVDPTRGLPLEEVIPEGPSGPFGGWPMDFDDWSGDGLPDLLSANAGLRISRNLGGGKLAGWETLPVSESYALGGALIDYFHVVRDPRLRSGRGLVVVLSDFAEFGETAYRLALITEDASGALELSDVVPISLPTDPTVGFRGFSQDPGKPLLVSLHDWSSTVNRDALRGGMTTVMELGVDVRRGAARLVTTTRARFPRAAWPIRQADMDDDGIDDLLAMVHPANGSGGRLHYHHGNRKGGFAAKPVAITATATDDTVTHVTDFDGDGDQDLVARGFSTTDVLEEIALWENAGDGNLSRRVILPGLVNAEVISIADRNGDSRPDLLVSAVTLKRDDTRERSVLLSLSGKGRARRVQTLLREAVDYSWQAWRVKAGDWDGDGTDDLLLWGKWWDSPSASPVRWVKGLPGLRFGAPLPLGSSFYETLQDMDGDGDLDLVCSRELLDTSDGVQTGWRENTGADTEPVYHAFPDLDGEEGTRMLVSAEADFNQDGRIDLLLSAPNRFADDACVPVIVGAGPTFTELAPLPTGTPWFHDMEGDGDTDVILTARQAPRWETNAMSLLENTGGGNFAAAVGIGEPAHADWNPVLAGDLDGDGKTDVVGSTVNIRPRIEWFKATP
jgi:hypothetical protein